MGRPKKQVATVEPVAKDKSVDMKRILAELNKDNKGDPAELGSDIVRKGTLSTGSYNLDAILGGGYIRGKIVELYGPESVGKTALAYKCLAGVVGPKAYVDAESNYDRETAESFGIDLETLIVKKPMTLEEGLQVVLDLVELGVEVIVYDSIAGLAPKDEVEATLDQNQVALKARKMGSLMRKLHVRADRTGATILFINQLRSVPGVMYGPSTVTPGGSALKFHASYRIEVTGKEAIKKGEDRIGHHMRVKVAKNKFGPPDVKCTVPLLYGLGICTEWEILDRAVDLDIIQKSGSWYSEGGSKISQGELATVMFLKDNPEFYEEILAKIKG